MSKLFKIRGLVTRIARLDKVRLLLICLVSLLFSGCLAARPGAVVRRDCNVVLVIIDNLRSDHLGCYGYTHKISPAIDAIAGNSVLFENAFSQAPYTLPSVMSILTSVYPSSHGMFFVYKDKLSPRVQTMAEIFSAYGYRTAWFSQLKTPHLDIDIGFGRGFQDKVQLDVDFQGRRELLSWIEQNQKNKFFLAMDIRRVHDYFHFIQPPGSEQEVEKEFYFKLLKLALDKNPPFSEPGVISHHQELFNGVYSIEKPDQIKQLLPADKRPQLENIRDGLFSAWVRKEAGNNTKSWIVAYDAAIIAVDQELIKPLQKKLKELGLYENTVIIITAGHGEAFGENNEYGHNSLVYEVNHVPLIIKMAHAKGGRKTEELAQGVDIMPTALELAGIAKPHQAQGKSLVRLISEKNAPAPNAYVFEQGRDNSAIRSKEWRLILANGSKRKTGPKQLYHLKTDPRERRNVYYFEPQIASSMQNKLDQWQDSLVSYKDQEYEFSPEIDQASRERIQKTGYW